MLRKSKAIRWLSSGNEEHMRIARELPDDLGTAYKVPHSENVLAVE
jgi:hypothetical protein